MQRIQTTGLILAILIAAGAAGFGTYLWLQPDHSTPVTAAAPAAAPALTSQQALDVALDDLDGNSHALADWKGKVLLVNFWATWCPPCREEIPLLVKMQAKYAAQGLQIIGIASDEPNDEVVRKFLKQMVVNYPILMSDGQSSEIVAALGGNLIGLPYSLLLDRDGKVLKIHPGELQPDEAESFLATGLQVPVPPIAATPAAATQSKSK
ncbi:MAG: TlpA family protein disulfide reductase [Gammaproteobacteria bacterium]|nr:TlpA family protein disulfide reductase [Gammaproteobacteria bacterium]